MANQNVKQSHLATNSSPFNVLSILFLASFHSIDFLIHGFMFLDIKTKQGCDGGIHNKISVSPVICVPSC